MAFMHGGTSRRQYVFHVSKILKRKNQEMKKFVEIYSKIRLLHVVVFKTISIIEKTVTKRTKIETRLYWLGGYF